MASFLQQFCPTADAAALATVSHALLTIIPDPFEEREFTHVRREMLPLIAELRDRAASQFNLALNLSGREEAEPFLATVKWISRTELFPGVAGFQARRYLSGLFLECVVLDPGGANSDVLRFASMLRGELKELSGNLTSRSPLRDPESLFSLVKWLDSQPQDSDRFPKYFWTAWGRSLSSLARRAIFHPAPTSADLYEEEESGIPIPSPAEDDDADANGANQKQADNEARDEHPRGWLPSEMDDDRLVNYGAGTRTSVVQAMLSTVTPLSALTDASNTIMSEAEAAQEVTRLLALAKLSCNRKDLVAAEAAVGRLLVLTTSTVPNRLRDLIWGEANDRKPYPGVVSLDGDWLIRPEIRPEGAAEGLEETGTGEIWLPLSSELRSLLMRLHPAPVAGSVVLPTLPETGEGNALEVSSELGAPSLTALRRTLLSRLARAEPLGITGAQWAAGDSLGLGLAPMHYDRLPADRLSRVIESIVFPWFGEKPGRARINRATHTLGSRVSPSLQDVREFHRQLRTSPAGTVDPLTERISRRTHNLVHGLSAFAGHRANGTFSRLTLNNFGVPDLVAVIEDKRVSPDWRARPIVVPPIWQKELFSLLADLGEAEAAQPPDELSKAAAAAIDGSGPLFLDVVSRCEVRPYSLQAFVSRLPASLAAHSNFARHILNSALMGRVPEAIRVGQLGWHGTREGVWADGSPLSPLDVVEQLEKLLTEHLKFVGWAPLPEQPLATPELRESQVDWISVAEAHRRAFEAHRTLLQARTAARHSMLARAMRPRVLEWLERHVPSLTLKPNGQFKRCQGTDEDPAIEVTREQLRHLELYLAAGDSRSIAGAVARNMLSAMVRHARGAGLLVAPIPRKVIWHYPNRPGPFHALQPRALRTWRDLDCWLHKQSIELNQSGKQEAQQDRPDVTANDANVSIEPAEKDPVTSGGLSEQGLVCSALLIHGGYADVDTVMDVMSRRATLHRCRTSPGVVLVNVRPDHDGADGVPPGESRVDGLSFAFHGLAAIHLTRWHLQRSRQFLEPASLASEIFRALPAQLRPSSSEETLQAMARITSARNALTMDGLARLVGTGVVTPTCVDARRVVALRDDSMGPYGHEMVVKQFVRDSTRRKPRRQHKPTLDELLGLLTASVASVAENRAHDAQERALLERALTRWIDECPAQPRTVDLLARFALALLQRGGQRKPHLQIRTIRAYVYGVARPLIGKLPGNPLSSSDEGWQGAFMAIVAESTDSLRWERLDALQTFHWALSQELEIPNVEFGTLGAFAGSRSIAVDPGVLTSHEMKAISAALANDVKCLSDERASASDIHSALARQAAAPTMAGSALRSGEIYGLRIRDVDIGDAACGIRVRASRLLGLKSFNAHRRARLAHRFRSTSVALLRTWIQAIQARAGSRFLLSSPLWSQMDDERKRVGKDEIFGRIGEIVRWVTGLRRARPYWLRKTGAWHSLSELLEEPQASLWPLRNYLARMGHAEITVTLRSYIHDPILPFQRWFSSDRQLLGVERLAAAANRSRWVAVRRTGKGRQPNSASLATERVAAMLSEIEFEPDQFRPRPGIPPSVGASTFTPPVEEIDLFMRAVANGADPLVACRTRRWPAAAAENALTAIEQLGGDYRVWIAAPEIEGLKLVPPRKLETDGGIKALLSKTSGESVLAEMSSGWLATAAVPGVPDGIPSSQRAWADWIQRFPELGQIEWTERQWGALVFHSPIASSNAKTSPWPLLRWGLAASWLRRRLHELGASADPS